MISSAADFFKQCKDKKIAVVGMGVSNLPLIRMLCEHSARVSAYDRREEKDLRAQLAQLTDFSIVYHLGEGYLDALGTSGYEWIFKTPGMRYDIPQLLTARAQGARITSEMELFMELCPCPVIAVTGSDGKTTTTTLIAQLLAEQGYTCHVGGNIGAPLLPQIDQIKPSDYAVLELSSFQLMSMRRSPNIAVVTNLAPNHLDVHKDLAEYIDAKRHIYQHQTPFDTLVVNADNEITRSFADQARSLVRPFGKEPGAHWCIYLEGDMIWEKCGDCRRPVLDRRAIRIPGAHNVENYMAAIAATRTLVDDETVARVARTFGGVAHRIEFVREVDGVRYYNDSIASSPTRTLACLNAFSQKLIVIAGGYDKKIPFEPMAHTVNEKVKALLLTGATAGKIEQAVKQADNFDGSLDIGRFEDIKDALLYARQIAAPGDVVVLSPACASFDKFANFEARGNYFKDLVAAL